ncbi:hypothetical protein GCM10027610_100060 [Dactylosporangium cerinum]
MRSAGSGCRPGSPGAGEQAGHPRLTLEPPGLRAFRPAALHGRAELVDVQLRHVGVAEARQDGADVAGERRVRADDEDVLGAQPVAVVEQQPRHAVQGDGGLPGAGAALDDEQLVQR